MNWLKKLFGLKDKSEEQLSVQDTAEPELIEDVEEPVDDKQIHVETELLNPIPHSNQDEELEDIVFDADKNYHEEAGGLDGVDVPPSDAGEGQD